MKSLRERTEIQQAYLDNAEIEYKHTDMSNQKWQKCANEPLFIWNRIDYRIKPKPMEIWINVYDIKDGDFKIDFYVHRTEEKAKRHLNSKGRTVKFIEAIE